MMLSVMLDGNNWSRKATKDELSAESASRPCTAPGSQRISVMAISTESGMLTAVTSVLRHDG